VGGGTQIWSMTNRGASVLEGWAFRLVAAAAGVVHVCMHQNVMPINLIVRQNQPLKVEKSAQKAQMT
jgi:hypothetical protein